MKAETIIEQVSQDFIEELVQLNWLERKIENTDIDTIFDKFDRE